MYFCFMDLFLAYFFTPIMLASQNASCDILPQRLLNVWHWISRRQRIHCPMSVHNSQRTLPRITRLEKFLVVVGGKIIAILL